MFLDAHKPSTALDPLVGKRLVSYDASIPSQGIRLTFDDGSWIETSCYSDYDSAIHEVEVGFPNDERGPA